MLRVGCAKVFWACSGDRHPGILHHCPPLQLPALGDLAGSRGLEIVGNCRYRIRWGGGSGALLRVLLLLALLAVLLPEKVRILIASQHPFTQVLLLLLESFTYLRAAR